MLTNGHVVDSMERVKIGANCTVLCDVRCWDYASRIVHVNVCGETRL